MHTIILDSYYHAGASELYLTPLNELEFRKELKTYHESTQESKRSVIQFTEMMKERNLLFETPKGYFIHFDHVEENKEAIEELEFAEENKPVSE